MKIWPSGDLFEEIRYVSCDLSISLYKAAPTVLPFTNFEEMAEAVEVGKIQLVAIKASASEKLIRPSFEQAQAGATAMKFYMADKRGNDCIAIALQQYFKLL